MTTQNKNVPPLRFSGFQNEWEEKRISDVAKFMYGKDQKQIADKNGKYPILGTGGLMGKTNSFLYDKPSVLIGRKGTIDQPRYMETPFWTVDTLFYTEVLENTLPKWLYYKFQTINWYLHNEASGVPSLSASTISKIKLNLPTLSEQQKIAAFFTAVDEKIQQLSRKKNLLDQYKKGLMQKIFNQEIRFKDDNGNNFADWEEKKFGDVITNKSEKYNPEKDKTNYKCIELEHLASETPSLLGSTDSNSSGSIKNKFEKGDVLFGKLRPYLKKFLLAPFDGVCSSEIWVLKGKEVLNSFLFLLIQTDDFISLANQSTGSKMPRADWNVISASLLSIPSKPEQQKIANFLSAIDKKINLTNQQLEKVKEYKKGLLQQMFI
jgi:type I restriction enzyme S subunit